MQFGYDVTALHYLMKPVKREKFFSVLDRLPWERPESGKLLFRPDEGNVSLLPGEIWYVEAEGHRCVLYTQDAALSLKETISNVEKRLAEYEFIIKCHRSYLVNLQHVSVVLKEELVMDDKRRVPLSRNLRKEVNDAFIHCYAR